jgi:hypothetical protein
MTEEEWLASTDPQAMLNTARSRRTCRKLRLFACAVCRADPSLMCHERLRQAVELCERFADGQCSDSKRQELCDLAWEELDEANEDGDRWRPYHELAYGLVTGDEASNWLWHDPSCWQTDTVDPAFQATVVRDLFGNLFHPVTIDPAWLNWKEGTILRLAETVAENRDLPEGTLDPDRLAILADALEDAGCTDAAIFEHLRGPQVHVRGCFILDAILGRE